MSVKKTFEITWKKTNTRAGRSGNILAIAKMLLDKKVTPNGFLVVCIKAEQSSYMYIPFHFPIIARF